MRLLLLAMVGMAVSASAQWQIQQSGSTADLRGIHSLGNGVAWASGSGGTVLRTIDNGATWQACAVPPGAEKLDFRGVQPFDAQTAIVMSSGKGDLSRLYKTGDGCRTWKLLFTNSDPEGFWDALSATADFLWILGDPTAHQFNVLSYSLHAASSEPAHSDRCIRLGAGAIYYKDILLHDCASGLSADSATAGAFAASNSAFLELPHAFRAYFGPPPLPGETADDHLSWVALQVFVTGGSSGARFCVRQGFNGGDYIRPLQWNCTPVPVGHKTEASGAFSIFLRDPQIGAIVGGDYLKPDDSTATAAFSSDGGKTWSAAITPPHGYRSGVAYCAAEKVWITVGPNGTDISTDDGRNWRALRPAAGEAADADRSWNALSLPFVVGPKGRIGIWKGAP